ncbi:MAG: hypothetical protein ACI8X5_001371 [Planctomycetota bacterium]|jgi:hypothetical protein
MHSNSTSIAACFSFLLLSTSLSAQWSSDAATNFALADSAGDQVQTKVVATPDGGAYISWFDSIGNGFDVRLQKIDASGTELWAHNGVLVADRGFSSTQDYGLGLDASGSAVLAFRDDRFSGVQISAARVSTTGSLTWGTNGIQLTNTGAFVASPKITGTSDGEIVVGWKQDSDVRLQRLDSAGSAQWAGDVVKTPVSGAYSVADLHAAGADAIISMVHQTGSSFTSPKHLVAQKLDSSGANLWGATPVSVFDSGSLQIGNFPSFVPDGAGGAVFAWYGVSPLQVYAQHLLSNGAEAFPHNGSVGSTNASQVRAAPSVSYDSVSGNTYLFWEEANLSQSQIGLSGQKFDASGAAQWSASGVTFIPVGPGEIRNVRTQANSGGCFVFWNDIPSFGADTLKGRHVDAASITDIGPFDVASTPSGKSRMTTAEMANGQVVVAWTDKRNDAGDVYIQNVKTDGTLGGGPLGTNYCFGAGCPCGNDDPIAGCANSTGSGARIFATGSTSIAADALSINGIDMRPNGPGLLFSGTIQVNGGAGLAFGDGLRCAGGSVTRLGTRIASGSGMATWDSGLISGGSWVAAGDTRYLQVWYRDPVTGPCSTDFNTSHGVELVFTP